jgi:uncharacterized membrane protein
MNRIRAEIVMIVVATLLIVVGGVYSLMQMGAVRDHLRSRDKLLMPYFEDTRTKLNLILEKLEARPAK